VAIGEGVTRVQVGDRVAGSSSNMDCGQAHPRKNQIGFGGCDRWNAGRVRRVASGWSGSPAGSSSYEEGATLPCAAVTAWHACIEAG